MSLGSLQWSAGFFDGDGCISIRRRNGILTSIRISAAGTNPRPLHRLRAIFGGNFCRQGTGRRSANWRQVWRWEVSGDSAIEALRAMLPYLCVKDEEAKIILHSSNVWGEPARDILIQIARENSLRAITSLKHKEYPIEA